MKKQMEKKARPHEGAAADWTMPQNWPHYTAQDHATWDRLFARQSALLPGRASEAYLRGLDMLRLSKPGIPDFEELSERLMRATGWRVVAVPGLVPDVVFFDHLANRRFRSEEHTSELQSLIRISSAVFCMKKTTARKK